MEISYLMSFKNNTKYYFDDDFKKKLIELNFFNRKIRKMKMTNNSLLKNSKLQFNKNKIDNKINLILNKISENNILLLVTEFIERISFISLEEYNIFLDLIFEKILKEIQFVDYYLNFFEIITICYYKKMNYKPEYFIIKIENIIKDCYLNNKLSDNIKLDKEVYQRNNP